MTYDPVAQESDERDYQGTASPKPVNEGRLGRGRERGEIDLTDARQVALRLFDDGDF